MNPFLSIALGALIVSAVIAFGGFLDGYTENPNDSTQKRIELGIASMKITLGFVLLFIVLIGIGLVGTFLLVNGFFEAFNN